MRILLTGPSGFLGSALARFWAERGHELYLLARPYSRLDRLVGLPASVRVVHASAPDDIAAVVREAMPDAIVHTACSYGRNGESALDVMDANLRLGMVLLQALLDQSARKHGPTTFLNTGTVLEPGVSLYALSKTQFSAWGAALATQAPTNLRFIDIRLEQMYGPGDSRSKFTTHVIEACRNNDPKLELTLGEQRRDLIHINDVVQAYNLILQKHESFASSDTINVGSGTALRIRDFVEMAKRLANSSTELNFGVVPYRENESMHSVANISRLLALGWRPTYDLEAGIRQTLNLEFGK